MYQVEVWTFANTWRVLGQFQSPREAMRQLRDWGWRLGWPNRRIVNSTGFQVYCTGGYERVPHR